MSNYLIYEMIGGVLLIIIAILFMIRINHQRKKKKQLANTIPTQILEDFEEAERRFKLENKDGNGNPYKILWDIWRERNPDAIAKGESRTEASSGAIPSDGVSKQSTEIQSISNGEDRKDNSGNKQRHRRIERI